MLEKLFQDLSLAVTWGLIMALATPLRVEQAAIIMIAITIAVMATLIFVDRVIADWGQLIRSMFWGSAITMGGFVLLQRLLDVLV